jgi:hypothetical protein
MSLGEHFLQQQQQQQHPQQRKKAQTAHDVHQTAAFKQ